MMKKQMSYAEFKRKAREHQIKFRENELGVGCHNYPNVLKYSDAKKGLIFYEKFRGEILEELKKPVLPTSSKPSGQMLPNLLRSEHIPYNIFFPLRKDKEGCVGLFNAILGCDEIVKVCDIRIEHHPEPRVEYLDDYTAFDVYISYIDTKNRPGGIGIEVKYTEKEYLLKKNTREYKRVKNETTGETCLFSNYLKATVESGYYRDDTTHDVLILNKFRQIWRNHILGASMVLNGDIKKFTSVTLYPQANVHFNEDAMPKYKELLSEVGQRSFVALTYEELFDLLEKYIDIEACADWVEYLRRRYLLAIP